MKNIFKLLGFTILFSSVSAFAVVYYNNCPYHNCPNNYMIRRNVYNPYYGITPYPNYYHNYYRNYYRYPMTINSTNVKNINRVNGRLRRLKRMHEMKRLENNISWFNDKNKKGALTGYSVPIKDDIYKQLNIAPYYPNTKQRANSIQCNQELFSSPSANETYYRNGQYRKNIGGAVGKTGVTIIYD